MSFLCFASNNLSEQSYLIFETLFLISFASASVLEHFVRTVQCRGMFSTHYHRLSVDYQNDPKVCQIFPLFDMKAK